MWKGRKPHELPLVLMCWNWMNPFLLAIYFLSVRQRFKILKKKSDIQHEHLDLCLCSFKDQNAWNLWAGFESCSTSYFSSILKSHPLLNFLAAKFCEMRTTGVTIKNMKETTWGDSLRNFYAYCFIAVLDLYWCIVQLVVLQNVRFADRSFFWALLTNVLPSDS